MDEPVVLVVGAGPTGLTLACELARRGVPCRIVDRSPQPSDASKAVGVWARTLHLLEPLAVADELVARGRRVRGAAFYDGGRRMASFGFDRLATPYRFLLSLPQPETEAVLAARLARFGVPVERGVELVGLRQAGAGDPAGHGEARVEAVLADRAAGAAGGPPADTPAHHSVEVAWVVGCDGAHSTVRRLAGIEFAGRGYPEVLVLGDVRVDGPLSHDQGHFHLGPRGLVVAVPLPGGRFRVTADRPADAPPARPEPAGDTAAGTAGETADETAGASPGATPFALLEALVREREPALRITDPGWTAEFRISARLASSFRRDRVLLAGDAAHIHSPAGGQGMNLGIADAAQLAAVLAAVVAGAAPADRLDGYAADRRRHAHRALRTTTLATRWGMTGFPPARALRNLALRAGDRSGLLERALAPRLAGLTD